MTTTPEPRRWPWRATAWAPPELRRHYFASFGDAVEWVDALPPHLEDVAVIDVWSVEASAWAEPHFAHAEEASR